LRGLELSLGGSAYGADTGASAAGHAGIGIDVVLALALRDGGNGTFLSARAAGDALVTDLICHDKYLLFFVEIIIHPKSEKCNIPLV
jgi:hypothetical protein